MFATAGTRASRETDGYAAGQRMRSTRPFTAAGESPPGGGAARLSAGAGIGAGARISKEVFGFQFSVFSLRTTNGTRPERPGVMIENIHLASHARTEWTRASRTPCRLESHGSPRRWTRPASEAAKG